MKASIKTSGPLSENASYKIVALLITLILWVIILGSKEAAIVKMIPANYILPKDMAIANSVPTEVAFRLTGPRLPLKRYSEINDPLTIDLSSASEGFSTIRVHPDSIDVPPRDQGRQRLAINHHPRGLRGCGINSMGVDVLLVGPLPTPGIAFLTQNMRAAAGIVISASHNPFQDNGIKVFGRDGFKLPVSEEKQIEELVFNGNLDHLLPLAENVGKSMRIDDAIAATWCM
ncbi:unnamed protein product [Sphagnum balticum]